MPDFSHSAVLVAVIAVVTALMRFLPFLLFPEGKQRPAVIDYLCRYLPAAIMGMLVVYCLKNVTPLVPPHGIPELIALAAVILLHLWKRNSLISIFGGTAVYMLLVQVVFYNYVP